MGDVGLSAPVPYPSIGSPIGEVARRANGVEVTIGIVTLRLDKLNEGRPAGMCGATGTFCQQKCKEVNTAEKSSCSAMTLVVPSAIFSKSPLRFR
jgi:hypothetical protein